MVKNDVKDVCYYFNDKFDKISDIFKSSVDLNIMS